MGRFLRMALASAISFGLGGLATAADLAVKARPIVEPAPASTWTGFYVGINGGWLASNSNTLTNVGTDTGVGGLGSAINLGLIPVGLTGFRESGGNGRRHCGLQLASESELGRRRGGRHRLGFCEAFLQYGLQDRRIHTGRLGI